MAGTNNAELNRDGTLPPGPVVVLVDPQMGENIGAAARAMLNCGLQDLRLVRPRDGWPNARAQAMSSGALDRMPEVRVYETTADAVADCHFVAATTARPREQVKEVHTPRTIVPVLSERIAAGNRVAILFGAERTGLENDDIALSRAVITVPLNPGFSSLNLAQAVLTVSYEWRMQCVGVCPAELHRGDSLPVPHHLLEEFLCRLEGELDTHHFFRTPEMRPAMVRNIRNMFTRADLTDQEVRTLHGIVTALTGGKKSKSGY